MTKITTKLNGKHQGLWRVCRTSRHCFSSLMRQKVSLLFMSLFLSFLSLPFAEAQEKELPQTGISGLYEVVQAVENIAYARDYWYQFGFKVIDSAQLTAIEAEQLYGVASAAKIYRLQNGAIDSHGLLRLIEWAQPLGKGIGFSEPETIGSRMAVMKTNDIMRLYDIYLFLRQEKKEAWFPTEPITDDLFGLNTGDRSFLKRPVLVRENAVYGAFFNHVFFQRYGYEIPGYGTINPKTMLKTSEFTHHDFIIDIDDFSALEYLSEVLGLRAEGEPEVNGDWQKGPKRVFAMPDGYTHWYQGYVSPNNICGKLKFFVPRSPKPDLSKHQRMGEYGITMHSFYVASVREVHQKAANYEGLTVSELQKNEFGELSFTLLDSAGILWQILAQKTPKNKPITKVEFSFTNN